MKTKFETVNLSCNEQDIAFDIKYFLQDIYFANFISNGNEIRVLFDYGQKFIISVKESFT